MPKGDYIKAGDEEFAAQLIQFKGGIGGYATLLTVTSGQVTAQAADADRMDYEVKCKKIAASYAQAWTAWKSITRNGGTAPAAGAPVPPTYPTAVAAVAPGVEARFRDLCGQITSNPNCNDAIREALGIQGDEHAGPDFGTFKPALKLESRGGQVFVGWGWQGQRAFLHSCEIHVDRGDGHGFVLLAIDTTPGYTDTQALPAGGGKWNYKAIYRVGDDRVGQWSDVVNISVAA